MNIALVTTCKGRVQHLSRTLPQNIADNLEAKFVVLGYNDGPGLEDYIKSNHASDIESGRLIFYQYREPGPFRMAHSKNLAHRLGIIEGGDILVNVDADNFCGPGFDRYVLEQFEDDNIFLWSRMIKEGDGKLTRGISGRIAVTREAFLLVGGYDERFSTHSPDDRDFNQRLRRIGFDAREIDGRFLVSILHNDRMRYREYKEAATMSYDDFNVHTDCTVVNAGKVGCGTVYRNFGLSPINILPVPTRVWGVGMHKTATTSLHHALETLGYWCAHWPSAHWAKTVWREMNTTGRSKSLERFHAACDLPITLLFRKLDVAYPGSKFILTVRDEWKWLTSVRRHWSENNPFRAGWDNDPFSNRIHQILYGQSDFDPTVFLARYRRHNEDVINYFKDRPNDLLVMDMEKTCDWQDLCRFLDAPIPEQPYPVTNRG